MHRLTRTLILFTPLILGLLALTPPSAGSETRPKVMLLHSYHASNVWDISVAQGVKDALADEFYFPDKNLTLKSFYMDTKRRTSREWKEDAGNMAREAIHRFQPAVVIALDDNCQEYVVRRMNKANCAFVFAGVNRDPEAYGIISDRDNPGSNITGALERERFPESLAFLRRIVPKVRRLALISDASPTGAPVVQRINAQAPACGAEVVATLQTDSFTAWKAFVTQVQSQADALAVVVYHTLKDDSGNYVPAEEVLAWTTAHSTLPDMGFWPWAVSQGLLCSDAISGYDQGYYVGTLTSYILGGQSPGDFPVAAPRTGQPCINKARADELGLTVPIHLTKTSQLFPKMTARALPSSPPD
ncbi:ABC transporter substrate binding protein [Desulfoluna sp.]|uniref:ABC transporter substrate-binding protein n=1 Tax=Desulfoluna sp. TaxID=2045199 RepID=UPI00262175C6|nr:ABC transporter substrate binding protein [Desulfoluna sp.]